MMKKYLYGLAVAVALSAPISADELYVRNRAFGDAHFVQGTTYVPAGSFLKALGVAWSANGSNVRLGSGDSPESAFENPNVTVVYGDKSLDLSGMLRGGKLYVPAKELATLVGYSVLHNPNTGVVDVVKGRNYTSADSAAEKEVAAAHAAAKDALKADREARQAKEKAAAEAKAKASGEEGEEDEEADEADTEDESATDSAAVAPASDAQPAASEEPKEPPKANLVVLSNDADPNYYTGECTFRAVIQNQGFAPAEGISAQFTVTGPDNRVWVKKTLYHGPLAVDGRWEISEKYKHPLASSMPRGNFTVDVVPKFTSGAVSETK